MPNKIRLSIWSDYVCPFCYLEKPVIDRLKESFSGQIDVRWHAYELRPDPLPTLDPAGDYLRSTWQRAVHPMASERGMALSLPPLQPRSRKALEAERFARDFGRGDAMHNALFEAYFQYGRNIGDVAVLADIGRSVGLDGDSLAAALAQGCYADNIEHERREAERMGITAVPAIVVHRAQQSPLEGRMVIGAQPYEVLSHLVGQIQMESELV
ncbi:MAG TPA: DsbA family oxidoreductase [Rhodocyclaceae bacterium]